jgi:hypothetical protein
VKNDDFPYAICKRLPEGNGTMNHGPKMGGFRGWDFRGLYQKVSLSHWGSQTDFLAARVEVGCFVNSKWFGVVEVIEILSFTSASRCLEYGMRKNVKRLGDHLSCFETQPRCT